MSDAFIRGLPTILLRGGGEMATGVAHRLHVSGFRVAILERPAPLTIRSGVAFSEAVHEGAWEVEGVRAVLVGAAGAIAAAWGRGEVPVLVDPEARLRGAIAPGVVCDATLAKRPTGTAIDWAPFVCALGPGFVAGRDVHAVVETQRGHDLGRVYWSGSALADTGEPAPVAGVTRDRVAWAPAAGFFEGVRAIGDRVARGDLLGRVGDAEVRASCDGLLRGIIRGGTRVEAGTKVADVDPRGDLAACRTVSDKARAIAGGVLEAVMADIRRRGEGT